MNDARYVRMHYTNKEFYDKYRREQKKNDSSSNPSRKKRVMRKMKRPNISEINEIVNLSVLRFRDAINDFIDSSFPQESDKPVIVGITTRPNLI